MKGNNKMNEYKKRFKEFKRLSLADMKIQLDKMERAFDDYQYNNFFDFEDHEYFAQLKDHYKGKISNGNG